MAFTQNRLLSGIGIPITTVFNSTNLQPLEASPTYGTSYSYYTENNREWDVEASVGNYTDDNGLPGSLLRVTGTPSSTVDEYTLTITDNGAPDDTAKFYYEDSTEMYGQTQFDVVSKYETINYASGVGYRYPRMVVADNGNVICVIEDWVNEKIKIFVRDVDTELWTYLTEIVDMGASPTTTRHYSPDIVKLPNGRLIVAMIAYTDLTTDNIQLYYSDDNGATWLIYQENVIELDRTSVDYDQLRFVYDSLSQIYTIVIHDITNSYSYLYSSSNGGSIWYYIDMLNNVTYHDMIYVGGVTVLAYIYTTIIQFMKRSVNSLWQDVNASSGGWATSPIAMAKHDNDDLYLYGRTTSLETLRGIKSTDLGSNWGLITDKVPRSGKTAITNSISTSDYLETHGAVFNRGSFIVAGNMPGSGPQYSAMAVVIGQIENVPEYSPNDYSYFPADYPNNMGQSVTGAGTSSLSYSGYITALRFSDTQKYYTMSTATYVDRGVKVRFRVKPVSGGSTSSDEICISVKVLNAVGGLYYNLKLRFSTTQVQAYDVIAAANKGSAATISDWTDVAIYVSLGVFRVYYKAYDERYWTLLTNGTLSSSAIAPAASVSFGNMSAAGSADSYWAFEVMTDTSDTHIGGVTSAILYRCGIPLSSKAGTMPNGMSVLGSRGQFYRGDTYTLSSFSKTGWDRMTNIYLNPSPRHIFESDTVSTGDTLYGVYSVDSTRYLNDVVGLAIRNTNATSIDLDYYDSGWNTLVSVDMEDTPFGATPAWVRDTTGDTTFRPNGTNGYPRYFRTNELVGTWISVSDGVDIVLAECIANTEGQFSNASGVRRMSFTLAHTTISGTYASLPISSTNAINVYYQDAIGIAAQPAAAAYYRIVLTFDYPVSISDNLHAGKVLPLQWQFLSRQAAQGGQISYVFNDQVTTSVQGFSKAKQYGPTARVIREPWRQLIVRDNYIGGSAIDSQGPGSTGYISQDNNVDTLLAIVTSTGRTEPFVYVPYMELAGDLSTTRSALGRDAFIYGRLQADMSITIGKGTRYGSSSGHSLIDSDLIMVEEM